ncbi:hypothetical protein B484DRAFT_323473, partial [Ochromonadaceae sp. CCMP2298]
KTTVGRIYGRVLQELGLLSDGAWEDKQASDLIGSAVGESEKLTKALVKRSMGKVLFIDEAYALNNSPFGRSALDTLVGLVHGAPGEDIAVVVAGYEKQMKKIFREANGGLSSRFDLDSAFRFEDFDDADLGRVVRAEVSGLQGVMCDAVVCAAYSPHSIFCHVNTHTHPHSPTLTHVRSRLLTTP